MHPCFNFYYLILIRFMIGPRQGTVKEQLVWAYEYPIQWREPQFNLSELARLRWISGLSKKELAY